MDQQTPVSQGDPLWEAWLLYEKSESYRNTRKWALHDQHVDGSLWAAFMAGWLRRGEFDGWLRRGEFDGCSSGNEKA